MEVRRDELFTTLTKEYAAKQNAMETLGLADPSERLVGSSLRGALVEHLNGLLQVQTAGDDDGSHNPDSDNYFPYPAKYNPSAQPTRPAAADADPLLGGVLSVTQSALAPGAPVPSTASSAVFNLRMQLRSSATRLRALVTEALLLRGAGAQVMLHSG